MWKQTPEPFSTVDSPSDLFLGSRPSKIARNSAGTFVGLGEAGGASAAGQPGCETLRYRILLSKAGAELNVLEATTTTCREIVWVCLFVCFPPFLPLKY